MNPNTNRLRWGLRATLALGVAASVAANVLHARNNPISQGIAAWPPVALLLTVEWITRVPVRSRYRSAAAFSRAPVTCSSAAGSGGSRGSPVSGS